MQVKIAAHFPKQILIDLFKMIKINILKGVDFSHRSHLKESEYFIFDFFDLNSLGIHLSCLIFIHPENICGQVFNVIPFVQLKLVRKLQKLSLDVIFIRLLQKHLLHVLLLFIILAPGT